MNTLKLFSCEPESIPNITTWYLTDLAEAKGKQELYTSQTPQKLKVLREHALIESAVSSNRIEGVTVDNSRIGTLLFGKPALQDRNEEEIKGYKEALNLLHDSTDGLPVKSETMLKLHRLCRGDIWDAGQYKEKQVDIIQKYLDGTQRVRFATVPPEQTPQMMNQMITLWDEGLRENWVHPLLMLAGLNLEFLCIHPFRDGNGRVSRLLLLQACYILGFDVGRYISIEKIIEDNKERYYETLEQSSQGWHDMKHNPWPYINFCLFVFKEAYRAFEERIKNMQNVKGQKSDIIIAAIRNQNTPFTLSTICHACPEVSREWIRKQLAIMKTQGAVTCHGRGVAAKWSYKGTTS